ncbi:MAG: HAD family hydrolase [Cyanobacteria bacterium J06606_4]
MRPQRLTSALDDADFKEALSRIRLVATDMDGTLTAEGKFTPGLIGALDALKRHGIEVLVVTGRSAGWVSGLVHYLPIAGAIAENGGVYLHEKLAEPLILPDIPRMSQHRDRLSNVFARLRGQYPHLRPAADNAYRITDWTFDVAGLEAEDLEWMQQTCAAQSMGFTYSTVQCHIKVVRQKKAAGLARVLKEHFGSISAADVVTVGDSPNDVSLFSPEQFPYSVGVANVKNYLPTLTYAPAYITDKPEVAGFLELAEQLMAAREG